MILSLDHSALSDRRRMPRLSGLVIGAMAVLVLLAWSVEAKAASFGVEPGSFAAGAFEDEAETTPQTQAGTAPFQATTRFNIEIETREAPNPFPGFPPIIRDIVTGSLKSSRVELPSGFVADPTATSRCLRSEVLRNFNSSFCPASTQVGVAKVTLQTATFPKPVRVPVYNMVPTQGKVADLAFAVEGFGITHVIGKVRPGGRGVDAVVENISSSGTPIREVELTLWGIPASSTHDHLREENGVSGLSSGATPKAFLRNPTSCDGQPAETSLAIDSWQQPGAWDTATATAPPITGCGALPFGATTEVKATSARAAAPTGLDVDIKVPQTDDPQVLSSAHLRNVSIRLPAGMSVNSAAADGLAGCTLSQVGLDDTNSASCPDASKIGSLELKTPLIDHPLPGSVYLATQNTNPFNSLLALYLAIEDPDTGVKIKLPGRVSPDPATGQLSATFEENPQLPFEELKVHLDGGDRATLVNPVACGSYATAYDLSSWAGQRVHGSSSFRVDEGCATGGFTPGFAAGAVNPVAGQYSPFTLRVTRPDGQQNLATIGARLPEGMLAKLAGIPLCADALAAVGVCPAASGVGTATVGVGAGVSPLYVPQAGKAPTGVYLAGPYRGAPYSLVVEVPAQAGPFDLGTVAVRTALVVDPVTTQVTAASDPLPQILQGIPLEYRDVRIDISRPQFTLNPTSCEPMSVDGQIASTVGVAVRASSRFQVGGCGSIGFRPRVVLRLKGATGRSGFPKLRAEVKAGPGEANIDRAIVTLPQSEFLAQSHIRTICTRVKWAANDCPKGSIYGRVRAFTPLLDQPLEGNVYLRANGGARELPDLVADLNGQVDLELVGYVDAVKGKGSGGSRIRTRFVNVPDAPITKFVLNMRGGKKSLLENSRNLCRGSYRATAKMDGHNGASSDSRPKLKVRCGKSKSKRAARHARVKRTGSN